MRKQIWFGMIVCSVMVIPCFFVGGLVAGLINLLNVFQVGSNPDVLFMRTLFGIEAPGEVLKWIFFTAIPAVLQGGITGALSIYLTAKVYTGNNNEIVAYTTGGLYTGIFLVVFTIAMINVGFKLSYIQVLLQLIGIWFGLIAMLAELPTLSSTQKTA
jgi:hypothetical protein